MIQGNTMIETALSELSTETLARIAGELYHSDIREARDLQKVAVTRLVRRIDSLEQVTDLMRPHTKR